ncbi:MAG TPA: DUF4418 family protein [bacterium]|nr:DUF4418 family protein [bacterium]
MKARAVGIAVVALGVLLVLTPWVIFPVCGVGRFAPGPGIAPGMHPCHGTLQAETVLGAAAIVIGFIPVLWPRKKAVLGASLGAAAVAVLAVLFPLAITGLCKVVTMPCRLGTLPALETVATLMMLAAALGLTVYRGLR